MEFGFSKPLGFFRELEFACPGSGFLSIPKFLKIQKSESSNMNTDIFWIINLDSMEIEKSFLDQPFWVFIF